METIEAFADETVFRNDENGYTVLVVKAGNENNEGVQALVKVLKSDEIKQFINDTYDGAVIPFED
mgnify:CR=1 FL=1